MAPQKARMVRRNTNGGTGKEPCLDFGKFGEDGLKQPLCCRSERVKLVKPE
jgi:hypothetical protein